MTASAGTNWETLPFFREFGVRVEAAEDGYARLAVPREMVRLRGARDAISGGVLAPLGEAAMRVCLDTVLRAGERAGRTRELTVAYLSGARGQITLVEARILRKGGRLAVGDVEARDAATGELNAKLRISCEIDPP